MAVANRLEPEKCFYLIQIMMVLLKSTVFFRKRDYMLGSKRPFSSVMIIGFCLPSALKRENQKRIPKKVKKVLFCANAHQKCGQIYSYRIQIKLWKILQVKGDDQFIITK